MIRPVNQNDLTDIHEICSMREVAEGAGWTASENLDMSVKRMLEYMDDNETLAVVLKDENKLIGTISLQKRYWPMYPIDRKLKGRELGFDLNRRYWGQGLMPEAAGEIIRHGFEEIGMNKIWCGYYDGNTRSKRVQEKCGFRYQWTTRDVDVPLMHEKRVGHVNLLTREDWLNPESL